MALKLGELVAYLKADKKQFDRDLQEGKREFKRTGDDMDRSAAATAASIAARWGGSLSSLASGWRSSRGQFDTHIEAAKGKLRELAREYDKTGNKSLLGDISKQRSQLRELEAAAGELGTGGFAAARNALSNFGTGVTNVVTNVWNLIPALAAIGATAAFAMPSVYLLGGALGSLPALAAGGGAALGTLALGFTGLSDAFKKTASAGGAVVDKAWQVAQAERRVRDANLEVLASQEALTRARETAAKRIDDLNRSITNAHLDERAAVLAVADAQKALTLAQRNGNPDEIAHAQLAYDQAAQSLDDVRARLKDMTAEQQRNAKAGVQGSDEVKAALDRQRRAIEGVTDAQHALKEAQKPPPGGGAAVEMTKLAASAQAVVNVIKALKPAWESLRLDVQQRLFSGVAGEVKTLAQAWLPQLHTSLGGMATTFNGLFRIFSRSARQPEFIRNIGAGIETVRWAIERVGKSVAGPFMDAFGRLAKAAGPFITQLGAEVGDLVDDFSRWIAAADKSGSLDTFFSRAQGFLHDVFDIGRDVASIIGSIVQILFTSPESAANAPFDGFKEFMDDAAKWFKDPENQKKVREWFQKVEDFVVWLGTDAIPKVQGWVDKIDKWVTKADEWGDKIVRFKNNVVGMFNSVIGFFKSLPKKISKAVGGLWDGLKNSFRAAINWIIGKWNNFSLTLGGGSVLGMNIPSVTLNTRDIPYLAKGGTALTSGLAVVGDRGPELAYLNRGATIQPLTGGGPGLMELLLRGEFRISGSDLILVLRERVAVRGGNVQAVIGSNT